MLVKSRGLSLIELMIAMALGLILTLGVVRIFLGSQQTYTVVTAQSQTQENARVVKYFLGRAIRHAGYWDDPTVPRHFPKVDGLFEEREVVSIANNDGSDAAVQDGTDVLTIRFAGATDGNVTNCLGASLAANQMGVDRYYVGTVGGGSSANVPALMCQSRVMSIGATSLPAASTTQPLIIGVENLQFELGSGDAYGVKEYIGPAAVADWQDVKSIRYAVLATSNQDTAGQEDTRTYDLVDGESVDAGGDNRIRRVQRETVYLRNYRSKG